MTRRNAQNRRRFQVEFLEGRNALSHFGAHAAVAHALTHSVASTRHHEVQSLERNDPSPNDSSTDSSTDSSKDSSNDLSSKHS
jgi:hypothetical protein